MLTAHGQFSRLSRTLIAHPFLGNVLKLAAGTAATQVLLVMTSPILTRLYSPSDFGLYGVVAAVILLLNAVSSLRYELAITLPQAEQTAEDLLVLCLGLSFCFSCLLASILWFARGALQRLVLPFGGSYGLLWIIPLGVLAAGLLEAAGYMNIRRKRFGTLSAARVGQGCFQTVFQLVVGIWAPGALSLMLGDLVSRTMAAVALLRSAPLSAYCHRNRLVNLRETAITYVRFPKFMMAANFLNIFDLQLPLLLVPFLFGTASAGNYFLAYRVLILPMALVGGAVSQVFMSEAARVSISDPALGALTKKLANTLLLLYSPMYVAIALAGKSIFSALFGMEWATAGTYAQVLAPMALVWAVAGPLSSILLVKNRLKESMVFTLLGLSCRAAAIAIGHQLKSLLACCVLLAVFGLLLSVCALLRFLYAAQVDLGAIFTPLRDCAMYSLPLAIGVAASASFMKPPTVVAVAVLLLIGTYQVVLRSIQRAGLAE
jgi:O-antigen/teichoic acid export membrane protein